MGALVRDLRLALDEPESVLRERAARRLGWGRGDVAELVVRRRSLDARRGRAPCFVLTVEVWRAGEARVAPPRPELPRVSPRRVSSVPPPVIIGTGPAGLFAARRLADHGVPSLLLERGKAVAERHRDVHALRRRGELDPDSNVCFGEGGAGTYSDGKLFTRKRGRGVERVLQQLAVHGASDEILVDAHPHIGSNRLGRIVQRFRERLEADGCTFRFGARAVGIVAEGARVVGVRLAGGDVIPAESVVLAAGHAARGLYDELHRMGAAMATKPFAVGFRVEHPQALVDRIQYGSYAGHESLPPAEYRLTAQASGRGVYSFCMCPGGYVVPTPVEPGGLAVNGMSNHARGSPFANSAIVVEVGPDDIARAGGGEGPLAGIAFQRSLEQEAYRRGGGSFRAPAQRLTDFLADRTGELPRTTSYRPGLTPASLRGLLPAALEDTLAAGVARFGRLMRGFVTEEAILVAIESMTSAPLTLIRDPSSLESPSLGGLFPCGEGAGHAGGITSSAMDGDLAARALLASRYGFDPDGN